MYIFENLQGSYWESLGGGGTPEEPKSSPHSVVEYLKKKIDDLLFASARSQIADPKKTPDHIQKELNSWQKDLKWISFYKGMAVLKKTAATPAWK